MKYRNYYCMPKYSDGDKCYYGSVEGVPEISTIEAGNLDDFERLFHQAIDDYLAEKMETRTRGHLGRILSLVLIVVLLLSMILTCPKPGQHIEAINSRIASVLNEHADPDDDWATLEVLLGNAIARPIVKNTVKVDDYFLFSVGRISYQNENKPVSLGLLGHVFTISERQLKKSIEQNKDIQDLLELF